MSSPGHWFDLGRHAQALVHDGRIVAVAFWTPEDLGEEFEAVDGELVGPGEPVVMDAAFYLTVVHAPRDRRRIIKGAEPTSMEWPDELRARAWQMYTEWGAD